MTKTRLALVIALGLPFAVAYARQDSTGAAATTTVLTGHPVHGRDVDRLSIGHSTHAEVERLLGAPDQRGADGSLVYRASAVRRTGARAQVVGTRSTTFRFTGDVLTRICRERS